jgi:hypothetical protein
MSRVRAKDLTQSDSSMPPEAGALGDAGRSSLSESGFGRCFLSSFFASPLCLAASPCGWTFVSLTPALAGVTLLSYLLSFLVSIGSLIS